MADDRPETAALTALYPPGTVLLDEPLQPDPYADLEMGAEQLPRQLTDDEVAGARLLLVQRAVERIGDEQLPGVAVHFDAVFSRPHGARISEARLQILLKSPAGAVFADVAPVEVRDTQPVTYTVKSSGTITVSIAKTFDLKIGLDTQGPTTTHYACLVEGAGAGTARTVWNFLERPGVGEGVGQTNRLVLSLRGPGPFAVEVKMSCTIVRRGLHGAYDRLRELVFGMGSDGAPIRPVVFEVPPAPAPHPPAWR